MSCLLIFIIKFYEIYLVEIGLLYKGGKRKGEGRRGLPKCKNPSHFEHRGRGKGE